MAKITCPYAVLNLLILFSRILDIISPENPIGIDFENLSITFDGDALDLEDLNFNDDDNVIIRIANYLQDQVENMDSDKAQQLVDLVLECNNLKTIFSALWCYIILKKCSLDKPLSGVLVIFILILILNTIKKFNVVVSLIKQFGEEPDMDEVQKVKDFFCDASNYNKSNCKVNTNVPENILSKETLVDTIKVLLDPFDDIISNAIDKSLNSSVCNSNGNLKFETTEGLKNVR